MKNLNVDLLNLLGRSYVIDNCTAYLKEREYKKTRDYYMNDMLLAINNRLRSKDDEEIPRFYDLVNNRQLPKEEKTAEQVKNDIKSKMKSMFNK